MSFWGVMLSNTLTSPNYTDLVRIMEAIFFAEPRPDEKSKEIISNSIEKLKKKNEAIIYGGVNVINNLTPEEITKIKNK
jgi:hypothetical protein